MYYKNFGHMWLWWFISGIINQSVTEKFTFCTLNRHSVDYAIYLSINYAMYYSIPVFMLDSTL